MSHVDVFFFSYNRPDFLERAVGSFLRSEPCHVHDLDLTIVDDATPDFESVMKVAHKYAVNFLRHGRNQGYVESVNRTIYADVPGHVFLLNQDVGFESCPKGWLDVLIAALERLHVEDRAGMIGPMSNYVMNFQCAPCRRHQDGRIEWLTTELEPKNPLAGVLQICALSGAFLLCHRTFVRHRLKQGFFLHPDLAHHAYDDLDLSFFARAEGFTLWVHQGIFVWHDDRKKDRVGEPNKQGYEGMVKLWGRNWFDRTKVWRRLSLSLPSSSLPEDPSRISASLPSSPPPSEPASSGTDSTKDEVVSSS